MVTLKGEQLNGAEEAAASCDTRLYSGGNNMRNVFTILLILILPVALYFFLSNKTSDNVAYAVNPDNPSLLIFTSTMCMDCQKMKAVLSEVEQNYNNKINFVYIDALKNDKKIQDKIKKYEVTLVPTLVFTDANELQTKKIEGAIPKEELIIALEDSVNE